MKDQSRIIAKHLLKSSAVRLSPEKPFQWASGWASPIYCDNRLTLSYPEIRNDISTGLIDLVKTYFPVADCISGVATAGIPQASIIADKMNLPLSYVRPNPKSHGMQNQIEGRIEKGSKCVMVEDLISTGGSSLKAVEVLRNEGIEVIGLIAIFTYGFAMADENFKKHNLKYHCLSNYAALIDVAIENNFIKDEQMQTLKEWRKDPANWNK
ncbi:orotate phosphoribosyltransferase [Hyphobacterium sp. CCMP332]|nr:orotate phosphoribosyltransferase [Hyphobacterium sp. CCMP332]